MAKFNAKSIAKSIAEGLLNKTIGEVVKPGNSSTGSNTYFRVVVGSYKDRANAVKKQEELKAKGEDSFLLAYTE